MILRPYQDRGIDNLCASYEAGNRAPLLVSPTGSGKTVMLSTFCSGHVAEGGHVTWYAHRKELIDQAVKTLRAFGLDVGAYGCNARAPVQVETVQAALARGDVKGCSLAVFDEAHHHGVTEDWGRLMVAHKAAGSLVLAATATPERGDGKALAGYDDLIVVAQVRELVEEWRRDNKTGLVPVEVLGPNRIMPKGKVAQLPVDAHLEHARGRRNVVFAPGVPAAETFAAQFRAKGIEAVVVHGKSKDRERSLERFAAGEVRVLINVYVLTEGWDCPSVGVVTLARSVGSIGMLLQMCGRGARPSHGKTGYTVLDLRAACTALKHRPDQDCDYSLEGAGITSRDGLRGERKCGVCKRPLEPNAVVCEVCGREAPEAEAPTATGDKLVHYSEFFKADSVDVRLARLGKWMRALRADGKNPFGAKYKYRATYKEMPTDEFLNAAWLFGEKQKQC